MKAFLLVNSDLILHEWEYDALWTLGAPCFRGGYYSFRDPRARLTLNAIVSIALAIQSFCVQILFWGYNPNLGSLCFLWRLRCEFIVVAWSRLSYWSSINLVAILSLDLLLQICSPLSLESLSTSQHQVSMETRHIKYSNREDPILSKLCLVTDFLQSYWLNELPVSPPQAVGISTPRQVMEQMR